MAAVKNCSKPMTCMRIANPHNQSQLCAQKLSLKSKIQRVRNKFEPAKLRRAPLMFIPDKMILKVVELLELIAQWHCLPASDIWIKGQIPRLNPHSPSSISCIRVVSEKQLNTFNCFFEPIFDIPITGDASPLLRRKVPVTTSMSDEEETVFTVSIPLHLLPLQIFSVGPVPNLAILQRRVELFFFQHVG
ncbi:hypothetical protein EMCRGX_G018058 [Ephydatia muelleri]